MSLNEFKRNIDDYSPFLGVVIIILNFIIVGLIWIFMYDEDAEKHQAYLAERAEGIETHALVVTKEANQSGVGALSTPHYYVHLFSMNETFIKNISGGEYNQLQQGDFVEVVIKGDTIYFGNKQDKEEIIQFVDKEKITERERETDK